VSAEAMKSGKPDKFELAQKGTIFLDEIGELSLGLQAKLVRVLQEKDIEPLGARRPKTIDFRMIAAMNRRTGTWRSEQEKVISTSWRNGQFNRKYRSHIRYAFE
jgi:transcriptional regulator with PAS, ATPase and Fis domain